MKNEFRPASLEERKKFYKNFSVERVEEWFRKNHLALPQICALDPGTDTRIILNKKLKGNLMYFPFNELKEKISEYLPEDVYYDRNVYKNPEEELKKLKFINYVKQELVFDLDTDNIECKCKDKNKICKECIKKLLMIALEMKGDLEKYFDKIVLVYSGRGFHLHVLDKKAFNLNNKRRREITKKFSNYPIDPWVSRGYIDLIRMPYSLNGLVNKKVIPLEKK
ncbi:hypothetical protein J4474_05030 [Candidatus Pacearchaeota archaeon]|nr:hypothetical protein [Candidatus Pacearchaeota archaeon]